MTRRIAAFVLLSAWCSYATPTFAETPAGPLPPGSTIALDRGQPESGFDARVITALTDAIHRLGHQVLPPVQVARELARMGRSDVCHSVPGCDRNDLLQAIGADAVVVYSLWLENGQPHDFAVKVIRKNAQGDAADNVTDQDLKKVVTGVLAQALSDSENPLSLVLSVESDPAGARISVDGAQTAVAPKSFAVRPGRHEVRAELNGYVSLLDHVDIRKEDKTLTYKAKLMKIEGASAAPVVSAPSAAVGSTTGGSVNEATTDGPIEPMHHKSPWNYVAGGVLAAAGIGLIAYGVAALGSDGDCRARDASHLCTSQVDSKTNALVGLIGGGAAALGSAFFFVIQPIPGSTRDTMAELRVRVAY